MFRRYAAVVTALIGVAFVAVAIGYKLFTVGPAFERMTGNFRPEMTVSQLAALHTDLNGLSAVQQEFTSKVVPALATATRQTADQFNATMGTQFPAVATGLAAVPTITTHFNGVLSLLDAEQARFQKADAIPTSSLPATTVPWAVLIAGLLAIGVAAWLIRPGATSPWFALTLGLLLVVGPLILSLPQKASAADTMNAHLKPVYTQQLVDGSKASMATMTAMATQMQTTMLPALGQMLNKTPADVQTFLQTNFPAVATGIATMDQSLRRFNGLVTAFDKSIKDYNAIKSTSLAPIVWILIIGGALTMAAGAASMYYRSATTYSTAGAEPSRKRSRRAA